MGAVQLWKEPTGKWEVLIGGLVVPPSTLIQPDSKAYSLTCSTLCGKDVITLEATPTESMSGSEFVRRAQLAGSIQHVMVQGCKRCKLGYLMASKHERQWLYTTNPKFGKIIGVGVAGPGNPIELLYRKAGGA